MKIHLLVGLFIFGLASPVHARKADDAKARKHFEQGETLYRQGEFNKALAEYKKALAFKRHTAFIFNIAQCHRHLGNLKQALFFYRLFLSESDKARNREEVLRRIKDIEAKQLEQLTKQKQVGKLSLVTEPEGADVFIDRMKGEPNAKSPALVPLGAGDHLITVKMVGYRTVHKTVSIKASRVSILTITLVKKEGAALPPEHRVPPRLDPDRRRAVTPVKPAEQPTQRVGAPFYKRWWFWTGVGVGVVAFAVAGYAGSTALSMEDEWMKKEGAVNDPSGFKSKAKALGATADAMFAVGAAALLSVTVGAILVELRRKKERASALRVAPSCGPTGCGVWVTGRF
ncbi:MAG: PEGA domain-containing protein [bacterium]